MRTAIKWGRRVMSAITGYLTGAAIAKGNYELTVAWFAVFLGMLGLGHIIESHF